VSDDSLREHLARILDWSDAHADFDAAIGGIPPRLRGVRPEGLPHSPWELLEHLRFTQRDILDFCRDPVYVAPRWPVDYWPATPAPPDEGAWEASVASYHSDREELRRLVLNGDLDLLAKIPHGSGQTYLRELLLVADHTAYHVGQLVLLRRFLGDWNSP
jgi:hypothetical protein